MDMTCTADPNFLATAIAVMILLLVPMALPIIRSIPNFNVSKVSSIGGGMAMAAVFVFMVPDVVAKISTVAANTNIEFLKQEHHLMFLVFTTFLVAFCTMYALEKVALDRTKVKAEPSLFVFYLHMGILCAMLIALVSSFPVLAKASFYAIGIVCSLAVFEIFLEEVALLKHFGALYSHVGRYIVMLAIVIGWALGLKFITQESSVFTLMTQAFVIGMILTAVVKGEFDLINQSNNYIIFIVSAFTKVLIVLGLINIEDANVAKRAAMPKPQPPKAQADIHVLPAPGSTSAAPPNLDMAAGPAGPVNPGATPGASPNPVPPPPAQY
ncbi:MAG: hypothetical protein WCJ92_00325 [Alphaproteobacteria bacterium]